MKIEGAVLYEQKKPLVIEELQTPVLGNGQVLVKVLYSGICQTQVNEVKGIKGPDKYIPHMLGHEASGIVHEIGPGVTHVKPGDYVVLSWIKGPGIEVPNSQYSSRGKMVNAGAVTTFSTFSVVAENRVTRIPREVPADVAALLGCAVPTGAGMVKNTLKAHAGNSIAIFGLGGVGLSALLYAVSVGCSKIIAVDIQDSKLAMAREFGATDTINSAKEPALAKIRELTGGFTGCGVDFSVESSGVKEVMELAFDSVRYGGTAVLAGNIRMGDRICIDPYALIHGKKVFGTWGGETRVDEDIPFYAGQYVQGRLRIDKLITNRYDFKDINTAFEDIKAGKVTGRALLKLNDEKP